MKANSEKGLSEHPSSPAQAPLLPLPHLVPFSRSGCTHANVKRGPGDVLVDNAPYGRIFHSAVLNESGHVLYDLVSIAEAPGAIALAIDNQFRIALLRQWRPVPATQPSMNSALEYLMEDVKRGFWSLEVPRGFPLSNEHPRDTAMREAREELGVAVSHAVELGFCNFNTAIMLSDIPVFAVLALPDVPAPDARDEAERIAEIRWYTMDDISGAIARGEIRCGLTLAALIHLFASRNKLEELILLGGL